MASEDPLAAGDFGAWLGELPAALRGEHDADVPCAGCTACCAASQFVHVGPDETDALAHIPPARLVPAPGGPVGHLVMGYDERGRCPMLTDTGCSIYEHRPRTCRTYDCRVFAAAGTEPTGPTQRPIAERVRRWRFDVRTEREEQCLTRIRAAATRLRGEHDLPDIALALAAIHEAIADTPDTAPGGTP